MLPLSFLHTLLASKSADSLLFILELDDDESAVVVASPLVYLGPTKVGLAKL